MLPNHVAFIPDGNRRWAKKNNKTIEEAYSTGMRKIKDVLEWCKASGVKTATFWGFSTENFKRSEEEKSTIWMLFDSVLTDIFKEYDNRKDDENAKKVKVNFLGELSKFPENLQKKMKEMNERTEGNGPYTINILLGYGGRAELLRVANEAVRRGKELTEEDFSTLLYVPEDVDLVIRTGGEVRTSGYLPWQSVYAEWIFSKKLWPDFSREDWLQALEDFSSRERRFGR